MITTEGSIDSSGAAGVAAESVGGDGGNGDTGESGASGGKSLGITITVEAPVNTTSANAAGIAVLSKGGQGGNGGGGFIINSGDGAPGGAAGPIVITTTSNGNIGTTGNSSPGIIAQSIGGGGGSGGDGFSFNSSSGGGAAAGGTITIDSSGSITTSGNNSQGIFVQSVGGGGGSGGFGTIGLATFGGNASSGGNGGQVCVNNSVNASSCNVPSDTSSGGQTIQTSKSQSSAIYAQSIGGGGGAGSGSFGLFYSSGGAGSQGGSGGPVTVINTAALTATGNQSDGIYAQSVGGSGGSGGASVGLGASFGGNGGNGEVGGTVTVSNYGDIKVSGNGDFSNNSNSTLAVGIFAQSVGGGGGDGGISGAALANFGGTGGNGGTGNNVIVTNSGTIMATCGPGCAGGGAIFAQSVGGGGGNGGGAVGLFALGGGGGVGNSAGNVTVNNSGPLTTTAQFSPGIFAQSIGGGGGNGAFAGGIAAIGGGGGEAGGGQTVTVNNKANITTGASDSPGIFAQSVGGGGGNGGGAVGVGVFVSFALGGEGASGGNGSTVCVNTNNGSCSDPLSGSSGTTIQTSGDRSTGIVAQSVGGGGGTGGFAVSASVGLYGDVSIGIGGKGAMGGTGGAVYVTNNQDIITGSLSGNPLIPNPGQFSDGIDAESIGGGGGGGGFSVTGAVSTGAAVGAAIGGAGGAGNDGDNVQVINSGAITTWGDQAIGIHAASIGGGGGNGGFAVSVSGSPYASVSLSFGGGGAGGGNGNAVSVNNSGNITTNGALSYGILAESIGGGGGNGGFSVAGSLTISGTSAAASLSFGGSGSGGGNAGDVSVMNNANIITNGLGATGILAQSIGGIGGNGGLSGALTLSVGAGFGYSIGGNGGNGGTAGAVSVTSVGNITTMQANADGILAQAIGGGGGNGGISVSLTATDNYASFSNSVGGMGGTGGTGYTTISPGVNTNVMVSSTGLIKTSGDLAYGILAQSIGGSGGNGGLSIAGSLSLNSSATGSSVGGTGGAGNSAADVTVTTCVTTACTPSAGMVVSTTGAGAIGILAQSIGGGGGNGGFSGTILIALGGDAGGNDIGGNGMKGGSGGAGSDGGKVTVTNYGGITTTGYGAHGIFAQSVGGGGGNGGFDLSGSFTDDSSSSSTSNAVGGAGGNGGAGATVTVNNYGTISVGGAMADGIFAQSVGGGGGSGGFAISGNLSMGSKSATNAVGGTGAAGGAGGEVDVMNAGSIFVNGVHSIGILAQSIGGGGGTGGFSIGVGLSFNSSDSNGSQGASDTVGGTAGAGGAGSNGGVVSVTTTASSFIETTGLMDYGIEAQSVGGGGGNGGFVIGGSFASSGDTTSTIGGSGSSGAGGNGGAGMQVTVDNAGWVVTTKTNSIGIFAQSVGGGGGSGGFAGALNVSGGSSATSNTVGGTGGNGGDGGPVTVTNESTGVVWTQADNSIGILAQSVGGGGGNGGFSITANVTFGGQSADNTVGGSSQGKLGNGGGAGGNAGNGGVVQVTNNGFIDVGGAHSIGILAQSVGGGGGNGGFAIGGSGGTSNGASDNVGGTGGTGGIGGTVTVTNGASNNATATIMTNGFMDYGILAQSVGGGGGNGGFAISGSLSLSGSADSSVGGNTNTSGTGGGGGASSKVTVDNYGTITTQMANSIGIVAQSVGGGGGTGGFAGQLTVSTSSSSMSNSIGGAGGAGGTGGEVDVTNENTGFINTKAANSIGILAQSIGGGGGTGGFTISGSASTGGSAAATAVGGSGGAGGNGGVVNVTNNGTIKTEGFMSAGIYAQSVGGGGGNGGFAVSGSLSLGSGTSMNNSVGGSCNSGCGGGGGGGGGNGGDVTVINTGSITVTKSNSIGIIAQSIGGGGGSAGFTGQASFGGGMLNNQVGGTGGNGGNGGNVTVTSTGSINTSGDNSIAVLAQSVGGGGGNGAITLTGSTDGSVSGTDLNVGGQNSGGAAGANGTVKVNISGGIVQTSGALAYGLLAQAIGGGGGNSGLVVPDPLTITGDPTIQLGATGGVTGTASPINTSNANNFMTTGAGSVGLAEQSIGGGGGSNGMAGDVVATGVPFNDFVGGSGSSGGAGNTLQFQNTGMVTTTNDNAIGFLAQSIGGGGGLGTYTFGTVTGTGDTVTETVGGSQTTVGNNGATVQIPVFSGAISTGGALAEGFIAQSIGGGGGVASFVADSGISLATNGLQITAGGGAGGAGGNGNDVTITSTAPITTTGVGALGVVVQSIGGGGGIAQVFGVSASGAVTLGAASGVGSAGAVTLTSSGTISTSGTGAHAILAQSIGGGGGFVEAFDSTGTALNLPVSAALGGGGGNGGQVSVTNSGVVTTTGAGAFGIIAQSVGGGGGVVGGGVFATSLPTTGLFAGTVGGTGSGGVVDVTTSNNISTTGQNSTAIFAESVGSTGTNKITVNVLPGVTITGGAGLGNAIGLAGGLNNSITNSGTLTTVSGINGTTITGGSAADHVVNNYLVIGSVDLGAGANSFDNTATGTTLYDTLCRCLVPGAVFDSGSTVNLGTGVLSNEGLISPGGYVNVLTTNVTGNFTQSSSGIYGLDLDFLNQTTDRINTTGTASVTGTVNVNIMDPGLALPGSYQSIILHAAAETNSGLALNTLSTAVVQYNLTSDPQNIYLNYSVNFSPAGLTINEHSVGNAVNAIQTARTSPNFVPIAAALFYQPDVASLGRVYDSLSGEGASGAEQTAFTASGLFMNAIRNQTAFWLSDHPGDQNGVTFYDDGTLSYAAAGPQNPASSALKATAYRTRTWRTWAEAYGGAASVNGEYPLGTGRLNDGGGGLAFGADYQLNPDQLVGFGMGAGLSTFSVSARSTNGTVDGGHFAVYGAERWDSFYAMGILGLDIFVNEEKRSASVPGSTMPIVPIPGFAENLTGTFTSQSLSARFEMGYKTSLMNVDVTPFAALQYGLLGTSGFTEIASGGSTNIGLSYSSRLVNSLPMFLGAQFDSKDLTYDGKPLSAWLRLSWMHEFEPYRTIDTSFIAAPGFDFIINGATAPQDAARVDVGVKLGVAKNMAVFTTFDGEFSGQGNSIAGTVGFSANW